MNRRPYNIVKTPNLILVDDKIKRRLIKTNTTLKLIFEELNSYETSNIEII